MVSQVRSLLLAALVSAAVSCIPTSSTPTDIATPPTSARPSEPSDASSRTICATRVLNALVDAVNARDETALTRLIGPGPLPTQSFQWVSMSTSSEAGPTLRGPGVNEVDYTPEGARAILLRHVAQGERWSIGVVRASDGASWHGGVDAELHFQRQFTDGRVVKTGGKTALSCIASTVYVLSLGDE